MNTIEILLNDYSNFPGMIDETSTDEMIEYIQEDLTNFLEDPSNSEHADNMIAWMANYREKKRRETVGVDGVDEAIQLGGKKKKSKRSIKRVSKKRRSIKKSNKRKSKRH